MEEKFIEQPALETDEINKTETQEGSMLGKFKDAKSLLEAYNSLQAEFTRKCQKLAEFQKESEENAFFNQHNTIDDFIKSTNGSDMYKDEILEILKNDEINSLPNKYLIAYKIATEADKKSASLLNNPDYLDKNIITNEKVKEKVITNYLSNLNNISQAPNIISGNSTSIYFSPDQGKPTTIKQAGEIFSKMLK